MVSADTYRVRVDFVVPYLQDGQYAVWVCSRECGANKGFGDLAYGELVVDRHAGTATDGTSKAVPPPDRIAAQAADRGSGNAWAVMALASLGVVVVCLALYVWTLRRAHA